MLRLTFDDGVSAWTEPILDVLAEYERHATFFVVGAYVSGYSKTLKRMVAEGHRVGNHTFTHRRLTELDAEEVAHEFKSTTEVIRLACGETPTVWRAPMFARNDTVDKAAAAQGLSHMGADIIPDDWRFDDPDRIAQRILAQASPKAVVCLHDGIPPDGGNGVSHRQATVDALRLILEAGQ